MSTIIPLDPIPNQSLSVRLDGRRYVLAVKECGGVMGVTIERDGEVLISNTRAVAGYPLLPYAHLSSDAGNFIFTNTTAAGDAIPYYSDFGTSCQLVYSTAAEIAADAAAANA